jgi:hypothetical protein
MPETVATTRARRWLPAASLAVAVIVIAAVAGFLWLGGGSIAPEDVVVDSLEAFNARDLAVLEELYDPDLVVSIDFTRVGGEFLPDEAGRDNTLDQTVEFWRIADPTISWEIVAVTDDTVTVDQTTMFGEGSPDRIRSTYTVSGDLITRIDHVVLEVG